MAIYDCFIFFNEIDLLKLRLKMMDPYIDKFIIVEANKTFRGDDKPYNFEIHKNEFKDYLDKIIYIKPKNIPEYKGDGDWSIEYYSRNSLMEGLVNCKPDDIIILSDLDEIPDMTIFNNNINHKFFKLPNRAFKRKLKFVIKNRKWLFTKFSKNWIDYLEYSPITCRMHMFQYFLNYKCKDIWYGSVICKYKNIISMQELRRTRGSLPFIDNSGWHLSYFGGVESIKKKLNSIIDDREEINKQFKKYSNDEEYINFCITNNKNLFGGDDTNLQYLNFNEIDFPDKENLLYLYPNFFNNIN